MEFRLLGPVELWAHGEEIALPTPKLRHLLAALLWDAGRLVPSSTLEQRVWGEDAPPKIAASIQSNVSRLRKCLDRCGDPTLDITQISLGYRLLIPTECVDKVQFERTIALAEAARTRGDTAAAIRLLRSAEALVRGEEPLAGLPGRWAAEKRAELEEQIRKATVDRITLQIESGETDAVLPELSRLATKYEFDETILEQFMRTLSAVGRTTEALDAYAGLHARLREKGLEPRSTQLRQLHLELLRDEPTVARSPTTPLPPLRTPPPNTLDRDPPNFVGREPDVNAVTAEIEGQLAAGTSAVFMIDGMPGIGKSTLAVHLAYRLRARCPDGTLQLHLRGHDEYQRPKDPETALGLLLGMLGVETKQIQRSGSLDYLISLWREHTSGKRLLLLLDDAADAAQIAPLVPAGVGSIVLVTSRNRLTGLPEAARHSLDPMPDADAARLFIKAARMSPTSDPALHDIVAACAGFPFALAVAGSCLRTRPAWALSDLVDFFASTLTSHPHKPESVIGPLFKVFSTSYRGLPEAERVLLRRLSLNPGPRIHFRVAAVLADADVSDTDFALLDLVERSLLQDSARRYYQLHDMMRAYARYVCEVEERPADLAAAAERLVRYTLRTAARATGLFHPHRHVVLTDDIEGLDDRHDFGFVDAEQATAWLDTEMDWLRATAEHWFVTGRAREAAALVHMLAKYLDRRSLFREGIALHQRALAAWREHGDRVGEAHALTDLATFHWRLDAHEVALRLATEAIELWSELADPQGLADALMQKGRVQLKTHHYTSAIEVFAECVRLRELGRDPQPKAAALHHLGIARFEAGQYAEGVAAVEQALVLAEAGHDPTLERNCINSLAVFWMDLGDYDNAERRCSQALRLADQDGDSRGVAIFALNLAECDTLLHRPESALPLLDRALETFERLEQVSQQTNVMIVQAHAQLELGRVQHAAALIDSAAAVAERMGDQLQLASVYMVYGRLAVARDSPTAAITAFLQALDHATNAETPFMQATALRHLGDATENVYGTVHARRHWRRALMLYGGTTRSPETDLLRERLSRPYKAGAAA
ncbi:MAG TPA: BTAD domain-containing putative transcriptional regulator [Actinospica sp.]|nr:BTAD domain-containing putative transcriptional regulator [Actinospica sp.]